MTFDPINMKINYITIFILLAFSYVQAQPGYEAQNLALDKSTSQAK